MSPEENVAHLKNYEDRAVVVYDTLGGVLVQIVGVLKQSTVDEHMFRVMQGTGLYALTLDCRDVVAKVESVKGEAVTLRLKIEVRS